MTHWDRFRDVLNAQTAKKGNKKATKEGKRATDKIEMRAQAARNIDL